MPGSDGVLPGCSPLFCIVSMKENFQCLRCGNCCRWPGYVRISEAEADAIAAYLQIPAMEFVEKYTRLTGDRTGLSLLENPDGSCPYLVEEQGFPACMIQAVKPRQCQDFPLKWNFPDWQNECAGGKAMLENEKKNGE